MNQDHPQGEDSDEELSINQDDLNTSEPPMLEEIRENDNVQTLNDKDSVASSSSPPDLNNGAAFEFWEDGAIKSVHESPDHERCQQDEHSFQLHSISSSKEEGDTSTQNSPVEGSKFESSGFDTEVVRKRTEQDLVRQFGLRESYVKLYSIIDLDNPPEIKTTSSIKTLKSSYITRSKIENQTLLKKKPQRGPNNYSRTKENEGRCFISDQFERRSIPPYDVDGDLSTKSSLVAKNESESSGFDTEVLRKRTEQDLMRQFGLRQSYVKLHNIIDLAKLRLARNDEQLHSTDSKTTRPRMKKKFRSEEMVEKQPTPSKVEEEIKTMLSRVKFMEKKAKIATYDLKKSNLNKDSLLNKMNQITSKRTVAEVELRINHCKALELKMSLIDCPETEDTSMASIEELIEKLERIIEGMHYELEALRKEAADLFNDVEDAERSHSGIMEVLDVLQLELKGLQSI